MNTLHVKTQPQVMTPFTIFNSSRSPLISALWISVGIAAIVSAVGYLFHRTNLLDKGYCLAQKKYLTDEEKLRVALPDLLTRTPPAVIRTSVAPGVFSLSVPENLIRYRNIEEFLAFNPECCKVTPTAEHIDGNHVTLIQQLTGIETSRVEVNYLVRYRNANNTEQSIRTIEYLYMSNCGTPAEAWSVY